MLTFASGTFGCCVGWFQRNVGMCVRVWFTRSNRPRQLVHSPVVRHSCSLRRLQSRTPCTFPFPSPPLECDLLLPRHAARLCRRGGACGLGGAAGRATCDSRVGAAARVAVGAAPDLALSCEEGTAHFVVETMTEVRRTLCSSSFSRSAYWITLNVLGCQELESSGENAQS